jgi:hypothetical protein
VSIEEEETYLEQNYKGGEVDIASASGSKIPGFESRQGIRFLRETLKCGCVQIR